MNNIYERIIEEIEKMAWGCLETPCGGLILVNSDDYTALDLELSKMVSDRGAKITSSSVKLIATRFGKFEIVVQIDWLPKDGFSIVLNLN